MRAILAIDQAPPIPRPSSSRRARGSCPRRIPRRHKLSPVRLGGAGPEPHLGLRCEAIAQCIAAGPDVSIEAVAISNQRESVTIWDGETGEPLGPVLSWQCRRTAPECEALIAGGHAGRVLEITGLPIDPMFPGAKMKWLIDRAPAGRPLRVGTIDSWLIHRLTGGKVHASDASNAARSQFLDLKEQVWSDELCALSGYTRPCCRRCATAPVRSA